MTEVGALVERLENKIGGVAEGVGSLVEDMSDVKGRLAVMEGDVRSIKDVLRIAVPDLTKGLSEVTKRVSRLEAKAS